ncbi:hypothetical protein CYL16_12215 [Mycobacterium sp. EPG1]|nr:hypothetical protein CYL16_12215 [Mycobacterium sp. EPG1]
MAGPSTSATCVRCGSPLRANAAFCSLCGQTVTDRVRHIDAPRHPEPAPVAQSVPDGRLVDAGPGLRCGGFLVDLAAMLSPALPLSIAGAALGVPEVIYIVVPVAFISVWLWMQIWQGLTGKTLGKAMLGLRAVTADDPKVPGLAATLRRSCFFVITGGIAGLPVILGGIPHDGLHDRISGLIVIDVAKGANPIGPPQLAPLRRSVERGVNQVRSPISTVTTRHR